MTETDRNVMMLISAGGFWTGKHIDTAGYADQAEWKICGQPKPTMIEAYRQMFWTCDSSAAYREKIWTLSQSFDPDDFPPVQACHGVPPAMRLDPEQAIWRGEGPVRTRPPASRMPAS